jgi:hypothetical protein
MISSGLSVERIPIVTCDEKFSLYKEPKSIWYFQSPGTSPSRAFLPRETPFIDRSHFTGSAT